MARARPHEPPAEADPEPVLGTRMAVRALAPRAFEPELDGEPRRDPLAQAPAEAQLGAGVGKPEPELRRRRPAVVEHAETVAQPRVEALNTDKAPAYAAAIAELKAEGKCPKDTRHRQVKYLNNVVEADHGKLKLLIRPVRGFKTMKTAYATIKGFEVMRALRKGQAGMFALQGGIVGEARIVERAFDIGPCALTEAMAWLQDRLANAES